MDTHAPLILPARDRTAHPWRNGNGTASEVAAHPDGATTDAFDWRVSIATIETDSDFSPYQGVDRYLMPLSTRGLTLDVDGEKQELPGYSAFAFSGESRVRATGVTAPSLDLNLMVRRGVVLGSLDARNVDGALTIAAADGETVVIVLLDAAFGLAQLDAVQLRPDSSLTLEGSGVIAVARMTSV
jgi:environmental stress-induced protein Ves